MLLDPFEEEFDLPAMTVQFGNGACRQREVVGRKHQASVGILIEEAYTPELLRIFLAGIEVPGGDDLVALKSRDFVYWLRVQASESEIVLGHDDEEGSCLVDCMKPGEVGISPIHEVDGSGFDLELIEDVHFVYLAVSDNRHGGNTSLEIQKGMELDRSFVFSEMIPGKRATGTDR